VDVIGLSVLRRSGYTGQKSSSAGCKESNVAGGEAQPSENEGAQVGIIT